MNAAFDYLERSDEIFDAVCFHDVDLLLQGNA